MRLRREFMLHRTVYGTLLLTQGARSTECLPHVESVIGARSPCVFDRRIRLTVEKGWHCTLNKGALGTIGRGLVGGSPACTGCSMCVCFKKMLVLKNVGTATGDFDWIFDARKVSEAEGV